MTLALEKMAGEDNGIATVRAELRMVEKPDGAFDEWLKREIPRRLAESARNPDDVIPAQDVFDDLWERHRRRFDEQRPRR